MVHPYAHTYRAQAAHLVSLFHLAAHPRSDLEQRGTDLVEGLRDVALPA